jgi:hypothetical protein
VITSDTFSRVQKLFVDRDGADPASVARLLRGRRVVLLCGPEVAISPTMQAAVLTAANVAGRCFPGTVRLLLSGADPGLRVPWPGASSLAQAVAAIAPPDEKSGGDGEARLVFGSFDTPAPGLRVTFDGWSAAVAPTYMDDRLGEREYCVLAGVAAGALAVGELFFDLAAINVEATHRAVGLSLWRPDLPWSDPGAVGAPVEYLPNEFWSLGLGHLGQAYLWCVGLLPFAEPSTAKIILNEFDTVIRANLDTGLLTRPRDINRLKTRVASDWMEGLGFRPRLVERAFDADTRRQPTEPTLALCGFDGKGPRHVLDGTGFANVIECGLGGTADDFDVFEFHTLGRPSPPASELWPPGSAALPVLSEEEVLKNPVYRAVRDLGGCGHMQLAGVSAAVPFMGAVAASLVVAESLRMLHEGERFQLVKWRLGCPEHRRILGVPNGYRGRLAPRLGYQRCHLNQA